MSVGPGHNVYHALLQRRENAKRSKERLEELCGEVLCDPDQNIGSMDEIIEVVANGEELPSVRKFAIGAACRTFIDIIPGYKIGTTQDEDGKLMVSKETKKIRKFESSLLSAYGRFLDLLESLVNVGSGSRATKKVKLGANESSKIVLVKGALSALNLLLSNTFHFNYVDRVSKLVIHGCCSLQKHKEVVSGCCDSLSYVLSSDDSTDLSLAVVRIISRITKKRANIARGLVDVLLSLKLDDTNDQTKKCVKKDRPCGKSKKKKQARLSANEEKEREEKCKRVKRNKAEILAIIFTVYLRFLKSPSCRSSVLSACLDGVSKFMHLVNVNMHEDLYKLLISISRRSELSLGDRLNALATVFKLPKDDSIFSIDYSSIYESLYQIMFQVFDDCSGQMWVPLLSCLEAVLGSGFREVGTQRCIAFVKRSLSLVFNSPSHHAVTLVSLIGGLASKSSVIQNLLDSEQYVGKTYDPYLDHPEYCNPGSTLAWEFPLISRHYDDCVKTALLKVINSDVNVGVGILRG